MTPTERAEWFLEGSITNFRNARMNSSIALIALGLQGEAEALQQIATGLRAVYLKLEEMERSIKKTPAGFPSPR